MRTAAPRAQLALKLERTCSVRGAATASCTARDYPQGPSSHTPKFWVRVGLSAQKGCEKEGSLRTLRGSGREGSPKGCRRPQTSPLSPLAVQQNAGVWSGPGAQNRVGFRRRAQDPGGVGGSGPARDGDAVTFRDPRLGSERARARCGPGTRGPARALLAGPLLRGAGGARSTWSAAARPRGRRRPAAAGIGSERGSDTGPGDGQRHAIPGRRRVGGGGRVRPGCPRHGNRWGAWAGRCGRAPVTPS